MPTSRIILILILSAVMAYSIVRWSRPPVVVEIYVEEGGVLVLDGQNISLDEVFPRVESAIESDPRAVVYIRAHADLPAEQVVLVAREVERAGIEVKIGNY